MRVPPRACCCWLFIRNECEVREWECKGVEALRERSGGEIAMVAIHKMRDERKRGVALWEKR